jgi:hypothetical protein
MTPADLARDNAISFECKKDALRQNQSGDWKIAFTVQGLDMDERLTKAFPGTRYMAVLVEIGADELPVHQPAKETKAPSPKSSPQPTHPPAAAKRMDWRELQPAAQAGIRCEDPVFKAFLDEKWSMAEWNGFTTAGAVRAICGVKSRSELGTNHKARVLWKQLDDQFQAWKAHENA